MHTTPNTFFENERPRSVCEKKLRALRILLIEDDTVVSMLFSEVLVDMGHEVCAIETTEAGGVAAALRYKPDLMIVDQGLSVGSGISAVDQILLNGPIPHIFASGGNIGQRLGSVVLQKPFNETDLERAIHRALDL